ncbi:MAG: hypothetical protein NZ529_06035 [Cytophagaceae bacterium]|nr:hypothetical protein [Cytophagaceae bacterium]MDW8456338.1 hypothetical protein [Cytophagaceae bacterium]
MKKRLFGLLVLTVICIVCSCKKNYTSKNRTTKYIAYVGRYTDPKADTEEKKKMARKFDMMHEVALQKYIKQINLPYTELKLKTFDCRRDGRISDSIYNEIAKDTNIVLVIDNTWGEHFRECAHTIRNKKIPVICMNADRNDLDYGGNVLFIGNNDHVPFDQVAFIKKALKFKEVNFLSEEDYPVHYTFLKAFEQAGIIIKKQFTLQGKNFSPEDSAKLYKELFTFYKNNLTEQNRLLVVNIHSKIGNQLLPWLDKTCSQLKILGHSYIVNAEHIRHFGINNKNELILISNPTDALSKRLTLDIEELKSKHEEYFKNPNHPMFVKRCLDATEMIKNKFEYKSDTTSLSKKDFVEFFRSLRGSTIEEEDEIYEFDSLLTMMPELYFTEYSEGKLHSHPLQLNLEREVIPNLFFGMEIVDIYDININTNSFTSDFYYWVKLDSSNRDAEKFIIFQNMKQNESSRELIFEKTDGKTIYKLYKVSGVFYVNYQLDDYPFDSQELFIRAEILNPSNKLKVSFDQKSFQLDPNAIDKFKITEWDKQKYYVTVENEISRGMHGDPDIDEEKLSEFKNIYFRLQVKRKIISPLLEIVLPLSLIGIVSIALLMIRDVSFENLGEVSIGVFITIVAFSISYSASTPNTDNLTRADFLFWITFSVVLLNFLIVIIVNSIYTNEEVKKMDLRKFGICLGVIFLCIVSWVLLH